MGINRLDLKASLDFMYENTSDDRIKNIIELVNRTGKYLQFIEIISNGNNLRGLIDRAKDEKMNYGFFMEQVFINKYDEIFEKIGD